MGYVLAVSLLTWGGVFLYLLRLEGLTKALEKQVDRQEGNVSAGGLSQTEANSRIEAERMAAPAVTRTER